MASGALPRHLTLGTDLGPQARPTVAHFNQATSVNLSRQVFPFRLL